MRRLTTALAVALLLLLFGCYTEKKAAKAVTKAILLKPTIAADLTRKAFPCITVKQDTNITYKDTVLMVDCPTYSPDTAYLLKTDTAYFNNVVIRKIQVPVKVQLPGKTITKYIEDSAKIKVLSAAATGLQNKVDSLENKLKKRNKWLTICGILLMAIGGLFIFKILRK